MRNRIPTLLMLTGLALGAMPTSALAQVAPPPTAPEKEPAKPAPTPQNQPPVKQAQPQNDGPTTTHVNSVGSLPTNIPYPKLAQKDSNGRIIRLKELPDILALRANPTVGPASVEKIMPVLYGRRGRFEMLTIQNVDLYWKLTGGMIDSLSMSDIRTLTQVKDMIKPLIGKTTLSQELTNRGILTRVQGGMNSHIVNEYKKAVGDEIQVLEGENSLDKFMQFILLDSIQESRLAYQALLAELIPQVREVAQKAGVSSPAVNNIIAAQAPLAEDAAHIEAQINAFDERFRKLSPDEAIAVLNAMREMRENPNVSPFIKPIDVMHSGKSIMENSKMGVRVESGEQLDARDAKMREKRKQAEAEREAAEKAAKEAEHEEPAADEPTEP